MNTVCLSPKSRVFLQCLMFFLCPWTQAKGTSEPFQFPKGSVRRESQALLAWLGFRAGSGTPSVRASLAAQSSFDCSPESHGSCHLRPWGVTADTDGDRQEDIQAGALTRTDSWVPERPAGSGRGCSQALPPRERRRSPIQAGRIPLCTKPLSPHLHVSDAFCPSGFPWTQAK